MTCQTLESGTSHCELLPSTMPLGLAATGQTVTIQSIRGSRKLKGRLQDLGLNTGAEIRIIQNHISSPLILAVKEDSRLALGRGMAQKILVSTQ